jgi:hypothetical protein
VIVADTNLLVALWAGGNGAARAERIRRQDPATAPERFLRD